MWGEWQIEPVDVGNMKMKLPKIPIDYSKAGYPIDGSTVLIHCEETTADTFRNLCAGVVEAHFELDGENSCWIVHANPENLGVTPKYYTPMPEFEVEGGET